MSTLEVIIWLVIAIGSFAYGWVIWRAIDMAAQAIRSMSRKHGRETAGERK